MKYMFLIYSNEKSWTKEEWTACTVESTHLCHDLNAKGQFRAASPLHPVATSTSVRVRDGQRLVTNGPFAETTEQLGGYYILDVANLDEAIAIASRIPAVKKGTVEIRPLIDLQGLPADKLLQSDVEIKKFMLICYDDEEYWIQAGKDAHQAAMQEAVQLTHELDSKGQYLSASPLHPASMATSVRIRDGKRLVTDGPFAETNEILGGYYLIAVKDVNEAIGIAARHSGARVGTVEVRQVYDLSGLPQDA
jgi:hypothetical protein